MRNDFTEGLRKKLHDGLMNSIKEGIVVCESDALYLTRIMMDITVKYFIDNGIIKSASEFIKYCQARRSEPGLITVEVLLNPPKKE